MNRLGACVASLTCTAILCVACPWTARAQSYHTLNLGGRAAGMGTAYTAIADDGTAAYYNPAGLGFEKATRVSANVTLNSFERLSVGEYFRTASGTSGLTEKSDPTLPIFASVSSSYGKKDRYGDRPFVVAFSVFTLDRYRFSGDLQVPDDEGRTTTLLYDRSYRAPYYGLSLGHRARADWGWGVSVFLASRTLSHSENFDAQLGGAPAPEPPYFEGASTINRNTRLSIHSYDLVFRFGGMKKFGEHWSLGLTAQPPGWGVDKSTELRFQLTNVDGTVTPDRATFVFFEESVRSSMPIPWEIRAGVAYGPKGRLLLSMDVQLVGRVTQRDVLVVPEIEGVEDRVPPTGVFFDARGKRKMVGNVYLGGDLQIAPDIYIRSGFLTNFDPDPRLHETSEVYESPRIHRYGFSFNFAVHRQQRWLQAGLAALFGNGYASGLDVERAVAGEAPFFRTEARSRLFLLSVTAANDFGRLAQKRIEARLEERIQKRRAEERETPIEMNGD
jgi:hypothetical protein